MTEEFRNIVAQWPTRADFAVEVGATKAQVDKWCERGCCSAPFDANVVDACTSRGVELSFRVLAEMRRAARSHPVGALPMHGRAQ